MGRYSLLAIGAAALLLAGFLWSNGSPPSSQLAAVATAGEGAPLVDVQVPKPLSPEADAGKALYDANCAMCHGANGAGQDGIAPPLVHKIYEPSHHGDASFHLAAQRGVRAHHWTFGDMPAIESVSEDDVARIIDYIRELQRANGID